jgi:hypothetical protein
MYGSISSSSMAHLTYSASCCLSSIIFSNHLSNAAGQLSSFQLLNFVSMYSIKFLIVFIDNIVKLLRVLLRGFAFRYR